MKKGHNGPGQAEKEIELGRKVALLQYVFNIPPHIDGFRRVVAEREISLIAGKPVRKIGGAQHRAVLLQMSLIPQERIVVKGISPKQLTGSVRVQQVEHQKYGVYVSFVKYSQIVDLLLIRKQILYRPHVHCLFADLHHNEKLRHKAFGKQEAGIVIRIYATKLFHKSFHIGVFQIETGLPCFFYQCLCFISVREVSPGELNQKALIMIRLIFLPHILIILLP